MGPAQKHEETLVKHRMAKTCSHASKKNLELFPPLQ